MPDASLTPFHEWLRDHSSGSLDDELTAALSEVVQAVMDHEKKGDLVLKLTVEPIGSGRRSVTVAGKVGIKPPEPPAEAAFFWVGDKGTLHKDDPYQQRMPGIAVDADDAPTRQVDPDSGEIRELTEE